MDQYEMLRQVSRTFTLSLEQLPKILRDSVTVSYLLLRVSDCLEDHDDIEDGHKPELLRLWASILDEKEPVSNLVDRISYLEDNDDPEVYVAKNAGFVLEKLAQLPEAIQDIINKRVRETTLGMARWQEHGPFVEDEEAMDDYMHQVAGLVGYLLTDVFSWHSPFIRERQEQLMPLSREYGLALQTVNIIRGMRKDYERGWVFVPQSFYEAEGLTRDSLFDPKNLESSMKVVSRLADKAERHLESGMEYITTFPRHQHRIRLCCMWPLFFAIQTLAISRNNVNVILEEAKLTRQQVKKIMRDTRLFGRSNNWLANYYERLSVPPHAEIKIG